MKVSVLKQNFKKELKLINKVAERKTTIPILQFVVLEVIGNGLRLTASNLDNFILIDIPAEVEQTGKCLVNARDLDRIIAACGDDIQLELADKKLCITSGKAQWFIDGCLDAFVELPVSMTAKPLQIPFATLRAAVNQVKFATAEEQSRYVLCGAKMIIESNHLTMVATDGHRMSFSESNSLKTGKQTFDGILKTSALDLLSLLPQNESITISESEAYFFFETGNHCLIARKLTGQFPNYKMVLPKEKGSSAKVDVIALNEALKQALTLQSRYHSIKCTFKDGIATLATERADGEFKTSLVYSGNADTTIGFNAEYLLDYCKTVKSGVCEITLNNNSQAVFENLEQPKGKRFRYIVMPVRL